MGGAENFDFSRITARKMINMDAPDELEIIAGCAGGLYSSMTVSARAVPCQGTPLRVTVRGLAGGHSGEDIHRERANAIRVLARILLAVSQATPLTLISYNGGSKDNAIPREAEAIVAIENPVVAKQVIADQVALLQTDLIAEDRGMTVTVTADGGDHPYRLSREDTDRILFSVLHAPCGVLARNRDVNNAIDLSCNLGLLSMQYEKKKATVEIRLLSRSASEEQIRAIMSEISLMGRVLGHKVNHEFRYAGWEYAPKSAIREAFIASAEAICGKTPKITIIHAGLECGTIKQSIPDMDIIACGPQVKNLHSPDEALNLASFERYFAILEHLLQNL